MYHLKKKSELVARTRFEVAFLQPVRSRLSFFFRYFFFPDEAAKYDILENRDITLLVYLKKPFYRFFCSVLYFCY